MATTFIVLNWYIIWYFYSIVPPKHSNITVSYRELTFMETNFILNKTRCYKFVKYFKVQDHIMCVYVCMAVCDSYCFIHVFICVLYVSEFLIVEVDKFSDLHQQNSECFIEVQKNCLFCLNICNTIRLVFGVSLKT